MSFLVEFEEFIKKHGFIPKVNVNQDNTLRTGGDKLFLVEEHNRGIWEFPISANLELLATYPKRDSQILRPFNVEHSFNVIRTPRMIFAMPGIP